MLRVMSRSLVPDAVERYVAVEISREMPLQRRLREETSHLPLAGMQIGADQGTLLAMLVRSLAAQRAIEVGTFTGYSALAVASALPAGGKLVCCDVSEEWTNIARRYWKEAGVAALIRDGGAGTFDFAFIDADKPNYDAYYEACLTLLRAGGLIALDNMLWSGRVADPQFHDADTDALRALNAKIRDDARVDACLLTVGDGVMLAQKRPMP